MKTDTKPQCQCRDCDHAAKARCSRLQSENRIRLLINAASAARAGAAQMTLSDWIEVEQEAKRKLQYEC